MKNIILAVAVVFSLALAASAYARGGMMGPGMGPGMGMGPGCGPNAAATPEQTAKYKKFVADTLPLKEEMHSKHMEMQKEWIKEKPDNEKIAKLQGELQALHQKMTEARTKAGIQSGRQGGKKGGRGMGPGMMGQGMGMGMGPGAAQPTPATAK